MREININQANNIIKRIPQFELSYETISHKKVPEMYDICIAIPSGKKYFAWFTFYNDKNVCYIFELNKDKKLVKCFLVHTIFHSSLSLGTLLYGVMSEDMNFFIIEDIIFFKGISLVKSNFEKRISFIYDLMKNNVVQEFQEKKSVVFSLPILWYNYYKEDIDSDAKIPSRFLNEQRPAYNIHHLQYRSLKNISPYLNVSLNKKINIKPNIVADLKENCSSNNTHLNNLKIPPCMDFSKPQYRYPTIFQVQADLQNDIYHLYAYGKNKEINYYNVAYIPNYKTSVFMNSLFRKIKENKNLDYIEESEDEDDFENINIDKFVDLQKTLLLECIFHNKFKKWIPIKIIKQPCKVVHISQLVTKYIQ